MLHHIVKTLLLAVILPAQPGAFAQVFVADFAGLNISIPDFDLSGASDSRTLSIPFSVIGDVNVTITLSGSSPDNAFNGDLYAYLSHDSGFSVLLNRPGRTAADSLGYGDNGFLNVTFDDSAADGDIHSYQLVRTESPLSGRWRPDARSTFPTQALDTDPRTQFLNNFAGLNPNGSWTLFVADVSAGGTATITQWGLEITPVPENPATALVAGILLVLTASARYGFAQRKARLTRDL
jgi:subtilisin-like proprotein convertase family protein